jgi:tetratricopeptide (TPR) repeat protein
MKLFKTLTIIFALLVLSPSQAQSVKQINKAIKVFEKDYKKGIAKLRKYMAKSEGPTLTAFETLVQMEFLDYQKSDKLWEDLSISVSEEGEESESDSTAQKLIDDLKHYSLNYFLNVCRRSTIESRSYTADIYLRIFLVDEEPDTAISDEGWDYFKKGEKYFRDKEYESAEKEYRKALESDTEFYKANLYIGDSFWARKHPDSAMYYYEIAKNQHPSLLEPRKYIIDALIDQGLYYRAKKECMEAMCVYPGFDLKMKMQQILEIENKWMNDNRFIRFFYPNDMRTKDQRDLNGIWNDYRNAKYDISKYCNEDGIIEENGKTDDKYLEVYSMRKMINKHKDSELPDYLQFALKMEEEGYLEPYVFVSLFHVDIYSQFRHYMSSENNRDKTIDFIQKYLIEKIP